MTEQARGTAPAPPHPRHDREFTDRCLEDLFRHWGTWRPLGRLYAAHVPSYERCKVVGEAVAHGRRIGFQIEGDAQLGYRVVGFRRVIVYMTKPGPRAGRRGGEGHAA